MQKEEDSIMFGVQTQLVYRSRKAATKSEGELEDFVLQLQQRGELSRSSLLLHLCMICTTAAPKCYFYNSCTLYCSNWKCYSAPLCLVSSGPQLADVTLWLLHVPHKTTHSSRTISAKIPKLTEHLSVSSHCGNWK